MRKQTTDEEEQKGQFERTREQPRENTKKVGKIHSNAKKKSPVGKTEATD